ncbi:MAG: tetratricopeptide repeat protein [Elusimicrobiota bacterium]
MMKRIFFLLLFVNLYTDGWGWTFFAKTKQLSEQKQTAQNFIQEKQYTQAIPILEKLSQAHYAGSEKIFLYNTLGDCYENIARYDLALENYKKALQINKKTSKTALNLARLYRKIDSYPEAISYYQQALKKQPKSFAANFGLGEVYQQQMLYKQAKIYYLKALNLKQTDEQTNFNLAMIYEKEGKIDLAVQQLKQLNKKNQPAYFLYLGKLYLFHNQPDRALESLQQAQKLNSPKAYRAQLHLLFGLTYLELKKPDLAENEFKQAAVLKNDSGIGYFMLGLTAYWQKKIPQAWEAWQQANKKNLPTTIKEHLNTQHPPEKHR